MLCNKVRYNYGTNKIVEEPLFDPALLRSVQSYSKTEIDQLNNICEEYILNRKGKITSSALDIHE